MIKDKIEETNRMVRYGIEEFIFKSWEYVREAISLGLILGLLLLLSEVKADKLFNYSTTIAMIAFTVGMFALMVASLLKTSYESKNFNFREFVRNSLTFMVSGVLFLLFLGFKTIEPIKLTNISFKSLDSFFSEGIYSLIWNISLFFGVVLFVIALTNLINLIKDVKIKK